MVTTEFSDLATNCPEYKVTALQIAPSNGPSEWQEEYEELSKAARSIAEPLVARSSLTPPLAAKSRSASAP